MQLQQAFVHTAEFLRIQRLVVDAGAALGLFVVEPADRPHRFQQRRVAELRRVEIGTAILFKEAPQRRQPEAGALRVPELLEHQFLHQPQITVQLLMGSAPDCQIAQPAEAVALAVDLPQLQWHVCGKQQVAVFRHAQEEQPIHQPQQLPEEGLGAQLTALQLGH